MQEFMLLQILIGFSVFATAIPKPENEQQKPLAINKDKEEHYVDSQHNPAYDHEAFLGEEAKTFDQLTPEESTRRLGIIVDKIDKNQDGYVTGEELKEWILYTQEHYIKDNVKKQWESHNPEGKETLPWKEYLTMVYGNIDLQEAEDHEKSKDPNTHSYVKMLKRDRRRWTAADLDGDDALTKEEFTTFLHAEEALHMKDIVVLETIEDIDKDGDGKISLSEYIGDLYDGIEGEDEPEWVKNEKEQYSMYRDKDGDGFLNFEEVKTWIIPADFDHAEAESRHLIFEADTDADQKLTKDEILEKYDIFVGSQATDFGQALDRHDEF